MESSRRVRAGLPRGLAAAGVLLLGACLPTLIAVTGLPAASLPDGGSSPAASAWPFSSVARATVHRAPPHTEQRALVVPVKFRVGGFRGLDVLRQAPLSVPVDCDSRAPRTVASPPSAPATGVLTYDWATAAYTFWWPRAEGWAGTCRRLILKLDDGSAHPVLLSFGETHTMVRP